jgi:CBS domain containing-hemolysin-like protein
MSARREGRKEAGRKANGVERAPSGELRRAVERGRRFGQTEKDEREMRRRTLRLRRTCAREKRTRLLGRGRKGVSSARGT